MQHKKYFVLIIVFFLGILFLFPSICFSGAKKGLELWFNILLPSLLPFLILSNLILTLDLLSYIVPGLSILFSGIFGVSKIACYPVLLGFLSGFPIAAKSCADLVKDNKISVQEGQYLLCFVNNASPMFITTYLSCQCIKMPQYKFYIYGIIICSSFLTSLVYRIFIPHSHTCTSLSDHLTTCSDSSLSFVQALDHSILQSTRILIKIGGYIILFSILTSLILSLPNIPDTLRFFSLSVLELTNGSYHLNISSLTLESKIILSIAMTAFGGFCSIFQTQSVIAKSGLSIKTYVIFKFIQAILTVPLSLLLLIII